MKLKKGDNILILKGKDKGKQAKVLKAFPDQNKIVAEGINTKKKHQGPKKQGQKGSVIEITAPFDVSKAMLVCPKCQKPTRVGYKMTKNDKARVCKKCNSEI